MSNRPQTQEEALAYLASEEWRRLNARRHELIGGKVKGRLGKDEEDELAWLWEESSAILGLARGPMQRVPLSSLSYDEGYGAYCYEGAPFTGVAFSIGRGRGLEAETEYQDGLRSGIEREWYPGGNLAAEGSFREGALHGTYRAWRENGQLVREEVVEHGILLSKKKWDEQGRLEEEYRMVEGGADWQTLLRRWELFDR